MRILLDENHLAWDEAWSITTRVFNYTNHTVLPEALEKWSVSILQTLLPRHMLLIFDINHRCAVQAAAGRVLSVCLFSAHTMPLRFLIQVNQMLGEDIDYRILNSVSIIEEGFEKQVRCELRPSTINVSRHHYQRLCCRLPTHPPPPPSRQNLTAKNQVRMANLAIVGSSHVNGVAGIHTEILRSRVFLPFAQLFPDKFLNITNGVTQVRVCTALHLSQQLTSRLCSAAG